MTFSLDNCQYNQPKKKPFSTTSDIDHLRNTRIYRKLNTDINLEFLVFLWIISFPCIRHDISSNSFWDFKKRNKTVSGKFYIHNKGRNRNFSNWMTRRNDMMISKSIFWSRVPMTKDLHSKGINNIIEYFLIWTLLTCIKQLKTNLWIVDILYYLQKSL